ncbi:unnamed protein product, partial [Meganyctiphanes norvegica]
QSRVTELENHITDLQKEATLLDGKVKLLENEANNEVRLANDESNPDAANNNIDPSSQNLELVKCEKCEIKETTTDESKMVSLRNAYNALEERFKRSMQQVAHITEEKTDLEHTIQQLEMETEAVGDYITIYQFQRGVLKQQIREREDKLTSLINEREEMRIKLSSLQELVSTLMVNGNVPNVLADFENIISQKASILPKETEATNEETNINTAPAEVINGENGVVDLDEAKDENLDSENKTNSSEDNDELKSPHKSETVQRILDLINEMESTGQTDCLSVSKNIHCCAQCSGQLIAV